MPNPQLGQFVDNETLPDEEELQDEFGTIPKGWYIAEIDDADIQQTNKGDGHMLALEFGIVGPSYEGRKVWHRINIDNPNEQAVEIGQKELVRLQLACGLDEIPSDQKLLIGNVCQIKIGHEEYKGEDQERVKGFRPNDQKAEGPFNAKESGGSSGSSDLKDDDIPF